MCCSLWFSSSSAFGQGISFVSAQRKLVGLHLVKPPHHHHTHTLYLRGRGRSCCVFPCARRPWEVMRRFVVFIFSLLLFSHLPFLGTRPRDYRARMDLAEPGVGDFVLLETVSEDKFMENLQLRFQKDRVYVCSCVFCCFGRPDSTVTHRPSLAMSLSR